MNHFVKAHGMHRTERSGVIEAGRITNRMATRHGSRMPAAGRR
jgi:hypothetical protein